jgi:hypothetical protein
VRERCRRSEAAWQALADRAERSEKMREAEARRKSQILEDGPQPDLSEIDPGSVA